MAINMLSENEYIICSNCKGMVFRTEDTFTLRKNNTPEGVKLNKKIIGKSYICNKCNSDMTNIIKNFSILNGDK